MPTKSLSAFLWIQHVFRHIAVRWHPSYKISLYTRHQFSLRRHRLPSYILAYLTATTCSPVLARLYVAVEVGQLGTQNPQRRSVSRMKSKNDLNTTYPSEGWQMCQGSHSLNDHHNTFSSARRILTSVFVGSSCLHCVGCVHGALRSF